MESHSMQADHIPDLSVTEALDRLTAGIDPLPPESVALSDALGRTLAEPVTAPHDLPPFANSSMDGFAVRSDDLGSAGESPVQLDVVGDAAAGAVGSAAVGAGQAIRIATGAPLPPGADAVVPVEGTDQPGPMAGKDLPSTVRVLRPVRAGAYIRPAGLDVVGGEVALPAGRVLRPQEIGLLAAMGVGAVEVHRQAVVGVLSTGDEVIGLSEPLAPGKIRDSNGYMIASWVQVVGAIPLPLGVAGDDPAQVVQRFDAAVDAGADLILSTAGVSMGSHDYVRHAVDAHGDLSFWRVNIRPGKPLANGRYRGTPFMGLPGNPVSSWVTFAVFGHALIDRLHGVRPRRRLVVPARLTRDVHSDGRESFLRARLWQSGDARLVELTGDQSSGILSSLVEANGLLHLPAGVDRALEGEVVDVWLMGDREMMYVDA
jgi:molybdopterin molybdotransferase